MKLSPFVLVGALSVATAAQNTLNVVLDERSDITTSHGADTRRLVLVDYDGDGDLDLYNLNYDDPSVMFRNEGGGVFAKDDTPGNALATTVLAKGVAFADMDGDGDQDAFVGTGSNRPNLLLRNLTAGGGTPGLFEQLTGGAVTNVPNHTYDAAWGDLDGDSHLDLVVVNRYQKNEVWFGDGMGDFLLDAGSAIAADLDGSRDVEIADLDLDGDLDVVVVNSTGVDNEVWVNRGGAEEGVFDLLAGDPSTSEGGNSYGLGVGDLNGDGLPEILVGNRNQVNFLYRNVTAAGALAFERVDSGPLATDFSDTYGIAFADVDANGHTDIVIANRNVKNLLYLATGAGDLDFERAPGGQLVHDRGSSRSVVAADLDGDGFPEVAVANSLNGANRFFDNLGPIWTDRGNALAGQAGAPRATGIGTLVPREPVMLRIEDAAPSALASVFLGTNLGLTPFAGGVLVPDLSTGLAMGGFVTGPGGTLDIHSMWPGDIPTGFSLFVQVGIADGAAPLGIALTNGLQARSQ